jgi:hypothetical protein
MKRFWRLACLVVVTLPFTPRAFAQYHDAGGHKELGVFGECYRWAAGNDTGLTAGGGRLSVNVFSLVQLEAEVR